MNQSRRHFLRAAGITIGLPFLHSLPSFGQTKQAAAQATKRMVFVDTGLGMYPGAFFPRDFGPNFTPSPVLRSMMKHRGKFTVFSNMDHPNVFAGHGGLNSFLNGTARGVGSLPTVDQIAASSVGYNTRFPSIHVNLGGKGSPSYSISGTQMRQISSPQLLFKQLFVNDSQAAKKALAIEVEEQGSVLDLIRSQAKTLGSKVNRVDKDKLDEYLTAIRDAESKLQGQKRWSRIEKPDVKMPEVEDVGRHGELGYEGTSSTMFDLFRLAIQTDSSRIFTLSYGMHNKRIGLDGITNGYHSLSHHGKRADKLKQLEIIESFYINQVSRFMEKLAGTPGGDENLLDDTMILFGSALSDAGRHSNRNLPIMIAGGGFKHKGHYNAEQPNKSATPLNNLYTSMLQNFGLEVEKYNSATGDVNNILT
ncbi:DUF1552 domain-containing protein [Oceaniferula spumae]